MFDLYCFLSAEDSFTISQLCKDIECLRKENAALREGRPLNYDDDDLDIDRLSDTSTTRDYLHSQLAKHNVSQTAGNQ